MAEKREVPGIVTGCHTPEKKDLARKMRQAMTPAEVFLWRRLCATRLGGLHVRRQQVIDGFIVDFYCHAAGLVVEVDGEVHHTQAEYDAERDRLLASRCLRVLRFSNARIHEDIQAVLQEILDCLPVH